jgi:hypothetical protein
MMSDKRVDSLSIRECQLQDVDAVLDLWRQAEATPSVTDNADELRRVIRNGPPSFSCPRQKDS